MLELREHISRIRYSIWHTTSETLGLHAQMLLDAYSVAIFPLHFLSNDANPEEVLLHQTALALVQSFEHFFSMENPADLVNATDDFHMAKEDWMKYVKVKRIVKLKQHMLGLHQAMVCMIPDDDASKKYVTEAEQMLQKLTQKICRDGIKEEESDVNTSVFFERLMEDPFSSLNKQL